MLIAFNNVFGYYLEVTHTHKDKVPPEWHRKQTLTGSERYITEELKERYEAVLESFRSNEEIIDCDLISSSGVPLTKEWKRDFLELCLRMIDAFWKSKPSIPLIIFTSFVMVAVYP